MTVGAFDFGSRLGRGWNAAMLALGPAVLWAAHLLACYFVVSLGTVDSSQLKWTLSALTVAAIATIAALALHAWRGLQSAARTTDPVEVPTMLLRLALWSSAIFGVATLFTALPIYLLRDLNGV